MERSEDELFERFRETGDPGALGEVYDAVAQELFQIAVHLAESPAAAEDLLQSTFVAAIEGAARFEPGKRVLPWLVGILANQAKSARASRSRTPDPQRVTQPSAALAPDSAAIEAELAERLDGTLERIPSPFRPVLVLRLKHGFTPAEIAYALQRPPATVRTQLARGLEALRRILPASFAGGAAFLLAGSARGLDAVRDAVVAQAASFQPTATVLTVSSILAMKKTLISCACVLACLVAWNLSQDRTPGSAELEREVVQATELEDDLESPESTSSAEPKRADAETSPTGEAGPRNTTATENVGTLRVQLRWEDTGEPASDLLVYIYRGGRMSSYWEIASTRTDAQGIAEFRALPVGYCWAKPHRAKGFNAQVVAGETTEVEREIPAGVDVRGRVVGRDGRAVPEAEIWLSNEHNPHFGYCVTKADRAGRFELRSIRPGAHFVAARGAGFASSPVREIDGKIGSEVPIELVLQTESVRVSGVVRSWSGETISGADVLIGEERRVMTDRARDGLYQFGPPAIHVRTDERGLFQTEVAAPGLQPIRVRARGFAPATVAWDFGSDAPVEIELAESAAIEGVARNEDGDPVANVQVRTHGTSMFGRGVTVSDARGRFRLDDLPSGEMRFVAFQRELGTLETEFVLVHGETQMWNPVFVRSPRVFGHVYDANGDPVAQTGVTLRSDEGDDRVRLTAVTNADGSFTLPGARAGVSYTLTVKHPKGYDHFPLIRLTDVRASQQPLELHAPHEDWTMGRIVGTVVGPGGDPVPKVRITIWHSEHNEWRAFEVDGETGDIEIAPVPPGTCRIRVRSDDYPWIDLGERTVAAGETLDLETIRLSPPSILFGDILDASPSQLETLELSLTRPGGEAAVLAIDGAAYASSAVLPGEYALTVRGDGVRYARLPVRIETQERTRFDIRIEEVPLRTVVVSCPDGVDRPEAAWCRVVDADGQFVWFGYGTPSDGSIEFRVSAPAGRYQLIGGSTSNVAFGAELELFALGVPHDPLELTFRVSD